MTPSAHSLPVVILGAGGHARVLLAILREEKPQVAGCIAPSPPDEDCWPSEVPYLGGSDLLDQINPAAYTLVNGIGSTGPITARREVFESAVAAGFEFRGLRHRAAVVDAGAEVSDSAQIMAGAIIQSGATVGENVLLNTGAIVDHDCRIGAHSHVATGARLSGDVHIGEAVHVGAGATVIRASRSAQAR